MLCGVFVLWPNEWHDVFLCTYRISSTSRWSIWTRCTRHPFRRWTSNPKTWTTRSKHENGTESCHLCFSPCRITAKLLKRGTAASSASCPRQPTVHLISQHEEINLFQLKTNNHRKRMKRIIQAKKKEETQKETSSAQPPNRVKEHWRLETPCSGNDVLYFYLFFGFGNHYPYRHCLNVFLSISCSCSFSSSICFRLVPSFPPWQIDWRVLPKNERRGEGDESSVPNSITIYTFPIYY